MEYGAGGAVVVGPEGARIRCQHVLITAPVTVLGADDITFVPPLPTRKRVRGWQLLLQSQWCCSAHADDQ